MKTLNKNDVVAQVYNDGIVDFKSKVPKLDKYGTPIPNQYKFESQFKSWWRTLGITSSEIVDSRTIDTEITKKIGVAGNRDIDTQWRASIGSKHYEIFRSFYNYKNDEMEISLVEVGQ